VLTAYLQQREIRGHTAHDRGVRVEPRLLFHFEAEPSRLVHRHRGQAHTMCAPNAR
jgi:hypothetical protein